jgi:hypothetical protein
LRDDNFQATIITGVQVKISQEYPLLTIDRQLKGTDQLAVDCQHPHRKHRKLQKERRHLKMILDFIYA